MTARLVTPKTLRFEARLAWLDGRSKRARELNKKSDKLSRQMEKDS